MNAKKTFFLDSNIFIYYFEQTPPFNSNVKKIFEELYSDNAMAVTSVISQLELLSIKYPEEKITLIAETLLEVPNLKIIDTNQEIALLAAQLRRKYGFKTPDAIQLATAMETKVDYFLSNDKNLQKCKEIKVKPL